MRASTLLCLLLVAGCRVDQADRVEVDRETQAVPAGYGDPSGRFDDAPTPDVINRDRSSGRWRTVLPDTMRIDTTASAAAERGYTRSFEDITPEAFSGPPALPLGGRIAGPDVLHAQVLLDRAAFSPGIIDGHWGDNVEKAVYFFQASAGLPATGVLDRATFDALRPRAGAPDRPVISHSLTAEDVEGPFVEIPEDIYAKAELERMSYESLEEQLSERFHASPDLLRRLNPGRDLETLSAGDTLLVPNVGVAAGGDLTGGRSARAAVARLRVSGNGSYLHALDASGRIVMHFPVTLGLEYDPSPQGDYRVTNIARNPEWRYNPALLANVPDDEEPATIPPGPNNAVGLVWMALSEPHYGIHGTAEPASIGYTSSSGCVRLTNWDALTLAAAIRAGVDVEFRDIAGREGARRDSVGA